MPRGVAKRCALGNSRASERRLQAKLQTTLVALAGAHPEPTVVASLGPPAAEFKRLVSKRNDLVHANPGTAPNGDQRLFRKGGEWTIELVNDAADEFAAASGPLNHHIHDVL